jgi:hypothetical protein
MQVGVEIEVGNLSRDLLATRLRHSVDSRFNWQLHDDGSIRTRNYAIAGVPIIPIQVHDQTITPHGASLVDRFGPEIVSGVLSPEDAVEFGEQVAKVLCKMPANPRASIHVHMSGFRTWQHIRNLVLWTYALEAPLYRIGGLGQRHRGELYYQGEPNDYKFCRPLSRPIHLIRGTRKVPLVDMDRIVTASTFGEFLFGWGRLDYFWAHGDLSHYCPHRLHIINLASLLRYQTVEVRLWNGVPKYIPDSVSISMRLFELAEQGAPKFSPMLIDDYKSLNHVTSDHISEILGMNINHLWYDRWAHPPTTIDRLSHYSNHNEIVNGSEALVCEWAM